MQIIIKYQTDDDREFIDKHEAEKHEHLLTALDALTSTLPKLPKSSSFGNGKGYLQHNSIRTTNVKNKLIDLWEGDEEIKSTARHAKPFENQLARILDDTNSPIYPLWYRLGCIDKHWREWGQPYFTMHPHEGKLIKLN